MENEAPPRYVIRCHAVGEFDAAWSAWLLGDDGEEIDAVLEADDKQVLLSLIEQQGGEVVRDTTEEKPFNRVYALMKFDRDDLKNWLAEFFGFNGYDGTYCYHLTRVKEAFHIGTMTLDDFQEFDDETLDNLADHLIAKLKDTDD